MKKILLWFLSASLSFALGAGLAVAQTPPPASPPPNSDQSTPPPFGYHAVSPKFWKLVDKNAKPKVLSTAFGFTEGEVWSPKDGGILYVSDENQGHIYILKPDGTRTILTTQVDPDGNTLDSDGYLLDAASVLHAIVQVMPDGHLKILADTYEGKDFNSPNDLVEGPDGAIYFTDPPMDMHKRLPQLGFTGVYRLGQDGKVTLLFKDLPAANGIAFSPDGKRLYVNDTDKRIVRVCDFAGGGVSNCRQLIDETSMPGHGWPDGMKTDMRGNIWTTGPGGIWVISPEGEHLGTITFPKYPVNFAWGGKDYKTLFVGSSDTVYELKTKVRGFIPWLGYK